MWSKAARKNPPVPHAGSQIRMSGSGCVASTNADISAPWREVLAGAGLGVGRVLLEQPVVRVVLHDPQHVLAPPELVEDRDVVRLKRLALQNSRYVTCSR